MRILVSIATAALVLAASALLLAQEASSEKPPIDNLPDDAEVLKKIISEQKKMIDRLIKELDKAKESIEKLKKEQAAKPKIPAGPESTPPDAKAEKQQPVEGRITKVRLESKRVLIDVGSDKGLKKGDVLEVSRVGRKIGRIRVGEAVYDSWCNAEIVTADIDFISGDKVVRVASTPGKTSADKQVEPRSQPTEEKKAANTELSGTDKKNLGKRLDTLEGLFADLANQLDRIEDRLEKNEDAAAEEAVRKSAPAALPEKVICPVGFKTKIVDVTKTYVILSAGTDSGLKKGDIFVLKRGDREIATVRVIKLEADICKADIISKNAEIQKRDTAVLE
jgi:prefoldin subunit 5